MGYDVLQCIVVGECLLHDLPLGDQPFETRKILMILSITSNFAFANRMVILMETCITSSSVLHRKPSTVAKASQDLLHTPTCLLIVGHFA